MSALQGEDTISMPPLRMATIEDVADAFLGSFFPQAQQSPMPVDLLHLAEAVLPRYGIYVSPASVTEMGDNLGLTDPSGSTTEILIREDLWDNMLRGGPAANRARATLAHEFGHAVLHTPVIRRRRISPQTQHLLARVSREEVPPYMCAEWQAWAFAGCILAPRRTIAMIPNPTLRDVASTYAISTGMLEQHLRRIRVRMS
ncbi:ImmA/IrrE family metallo-endopeptidase [Corallococcus interemptor]|uniref:ImmA/IrrE family metallo-endopeptidase n=1 Tax=Corallococcus interemptor TaxID=2316720 RepID=A0A3A8QML7_9BACT|nr:ImmA/IrrE family metallo-endopeptidase [Corallococcus interemptor]RKH69068.1 ImmA/IrrE family metallo-endopeptidase [Corallococcus interemptor]